jgi:hypothetical protein
VLVFVMADDRPQAASIDVTEAKLTEGQFTS